MSLRSYAKRRGVSVEAVSKAITAGRLRESVTTVDGKPKIADAELADREWEANTRPRIDQPRPPTTKRGAPVAPIDVVVSDDETLPPDVPNYNVSRAVREAAAARRENALADMAEIDVAEKRAELVPVADARADVINTFTTVKTKILGVPTRVAQRFPQHAAELVPVIDALLREVLEELSDDESDGDGDAVEA